MASMGSFCPGDPHSESEDSTNNDSAESGENTTESEDSVGSTWLPAANPLEKRGKQALQRSTCGLYCMYALVGINYGFFAHYINIPICQYVFGPMGAPGRASVQQCNVSTSIITMPWNFKFFYGFLIDSCRFCGTVRKGWILMGWSVSLAVLLVMAFATPMFVESGNFAGYSILCALQCFFYMFADVAGDGMTIELTKLESEDIRGHILTTGQMVRFTSSMLINVVGLLCMNGRSYLPSAHAAAPPPRNCTGGVSNATCSSQEVCGKHDAGLTFPFEVSFGLMHVVIFCLEVPLFLGMCAWLSDPPRVEEEHRRKRDSLRLLWTVMRSKAMLLLVIFSLGSIALASLQNPAQNNIANIAEPTTLQNSVGNMLGSLLFLIGVWVFRKYLMNFNWRFTFVWTSLLVVGNNVIQLLVVYNAWGVGRDGWFYVFGSNVLQFIQGIAQVLSSLAIAEISPPGLEATVYEILVSVHNGAMTLNTNIQNIFVPVFRLNGISARTFFPCPSNPNPPQLQMVQDMANATYFTMVVNVVGTVAFAFLFPKDKPQTRAWRDNRWWHRQWVGMLGAIIGGGSFVFAVFVSFLSLFPATMCLRIAGGRGCG